MECRGFASEMDWRQSDHPDELDVMCEHFESAMQQYTAEDEPH
jgi:hypothetical protein